MKYGNKVVVVPFQEEEEEEIKEDEFCPPQSGDGVLQKPRKPKVSKDNNFMKILLRLAAIGGYNENGNIKNQNGKFEPDTDISALLEYAMTRGVAAEGLTQFVHLLQKAKVTSDMVVNDNVKRMLQGSRFTKPKTVPVEPLTISKFKSKRKEELATDPLMPKLPRYNETPFAAQTYKGANTPPPLDLYDGQDEDVFHDSKLNWDDSSSDDGSRTS